MFFPRNADGTLATKISHSLNEDLFDLYDVQGDESGGQIALINEWNAKRVTGNGAAILQKCALAAGTIGVMPSQWGTLEGLSNLNTWELVHGLFLDALQDSGLVQEIQELIVEAAEKALQEVLAGAGQLVSGIPIIGWIADIIIGFVKIVAAIKRLHDAADAPSPPEYCVAPTQSNAADSAGTNVLLQQMQTWDWTSIFSPLSMSLTTQWAGPVTNRVQVAGFDCCPLATNRLVGTPPTGVGKNKTNCHDGYRYSNGQCVRDTMAQLRILGASTGRGFVPGTGSKSVGPWIHNDFIFNQGSVTDTGDWLPQTRSVGSNAWSYLWSGPTAFCADGDVLRRRWVDYIDALLDMAGPCTKVAGIDSEPFNRRKSILERFGLGPERLKYLSIDQDALFDPNEAISRSIALSNSAPSIACSKLATRQRAMVKRPVVAYVYAGKMPAGELRDLVSKAQSDILQSVYSVCRLHLASIPDPGYRAAVEFIQSKNPGICASYSDKILSKAVENDPWDPDAGPLPPIPPLPETVPTGSSNQFAPLPGGGLGGQDPGSGAGSSASRPSKLPTIALLGAAAGGLWYARKKGLI